ncbi:MAG TPA: alpha/beta fold hydrolase [Candidatus Saccharimonadales bacterium]|nr:alpha/beta fold hydrolase [Candidatus Saccharimonadales bacterium]
MTPDAHTIQETFLEVGDGHTLYVHDWGNRAAKTPIITLHGGPGSQARDSHKRLYDPARQRVIFFDQRGCGRSLPYGSLEHNTTQQLIEDISKIADHLKIKQFILAGGSWGSCLALAYALEHPERVAAMALNGIFTGSQAEIDWLDGGLFRTFYPDVWDRYLAATPKAHHKDPGAYHYQRVMGGDPDAARESGHAYETLEGSVLALDDRFMPSDLATYDPSGIRIEMHYMQKRCFMPDRHILDSAHRLTMPIWLVQGRYDMVCPPAAAYELHQKLPNGELVLTTSGHRPEHETSSVLRTVLLQLSQA